MWLDQVNEISEMFRYTLPTSIFIISMIIILSPADAAHEFPVYRLQHFDLQGIKYGILFLFFFFSKSINSEPLFHSFFFFFPDEGSRSSLLNFEARSVDTKLPARKCIILMINEFSISRFRELVNEGVGAVLIIIPADLDSISDDLKEVTFSTRTQI